MKKLQIFVWAAALLTLSFQVRAQTPEEIKQVENYLNGIRNLQASFVQTSSNGGIAEGMLYIAKPSKIRVC